MGSKKYKIVFSIAVHERKEIIIEQIFNLNYFNPDCAIVLHFSHKFVNNSLIDDSKFLSIINSFDNVYINPKRHNTNAFTPLLIHYSNFEFIKKMADFDYFSICNSNDIYLKSGLYEAIKGYDAFIEDKKLTRKWSQYKKFETDKDVKELMHNIPLRFSYLEGTCYSFEIFNLISKKLCDFNLENMNFYYSVDEIVIPSLARAYSKKIRYGRAIKNGVGPLFVNNRIIKKTIKNNNKYGCKRVDRNLYNYQRIYLRKKYLTYVDIYNILDLPRENINFMKYYLIDIYLTLINQVKYLKTRVKHLFYYVFYRR